MSTSENLPRVIVAGFALLGVTGCAYDPYYSHASGVYSYDATPAVVYHDYYYYPGVQVYWHVSSGYYWYYSGSHWTHSRHLPDHIHLHRHERVRLRAPQARPYLKHHEHSRAYMESPRYRPVPRQMTERSLTQGGHHAPDSQIKRPTVFHTPPARDPRAGGRHNERSESVRDRPRQAREERATKRPAQRPSPQQGKHPPGTIKGNPGQFAR